MKTIEEKATKLAQLMNPNTTIDPMLILALVQLLTQIIKMSSTCFSPKKALDAGKNPSIISKTILRRLIKKNLDSGQYSSCNHVIDCLVTLSNMTNEDEVKIMTTEAGV